MKKCFLALCLFASLCHAQTRFGGVLNETTVTVAFSATPTFDASKANVFKLTLTANVTSSTLSNAILGQELIFDICQDGTGSRTFVPPANVLNWSTISSTASTCSVQFYTFDGTNALPDMMPGLTGDVTSSPGSISTTVAKVNGVSFPSGPSTHSVPVVTASNTATWKVVPDCTDTTGNHLNYTQSTDAWSCGTSLTAQVVTLTGTQALTNKTLGGSGATTPDTLFNRFKANQGTSLTTGDVGTLTGWGSTATVSAVTGTDSAFSVSINSSGTGQAANASFVVTFKNGTWTNAPTVVGSRVDTNGPGGIPLPQSSATTLTVFFNTFNSTAPVAGNTYSFNFIAVGR